MKEQRLSLREELRTLVTAVRALDRDLVFIFISTAVLTTLSYYFASRRFFRATFYDSLAGDHLVSLYEYLYWFVADFGIYFLVPILLIALILRAPLRSFGLGIGDWRFGLKVTMIFVAVMLPIVWIVSSSPSFQHVYPHATIVRADWLLFVLYEVVFLAYFTGWEFIWRGYMLFGLEKKLGAATAILVQMIPFVVLHNGKPMIETVGAIIAAIALGIVALRARSFWYCVATHWLVMFSIDLISTLRFRTSVFGIGPSALIEILRRSF